MSSSARKLVEISGTTSSAPSSYNERVIQFYGLALSAIAAAVTL